MVIEDYDAALARISKLRNEADELEQTILKSAGIGFTPGGFMRHDLLPLRWFNDVNKLLTVLANLNVLPPLQS